MNKLTIVIAGTVLVLMGSLGARVASANPLAPGSYLWYVPEHEKYGRTEFYSQQSMNTALVRVDRKERFKIVAAQRGWVQLEFDISGKAFIPIRMLRLALHDPTASDRWYEFKRASIFVEDPAKIEARLKGPQEKTPTANDTKTPSWKRYKDSWGLKTGRSTAAGTTSVGTTSEDASSAESAQTAPRPVAGSAAAKARSKYPLLTPIGSEPSRETDAPETPERDAQTTPPR